MYYYYYYYINTNEIPGELSRENMISSHIKISCYVHMWKYHCCYGYIINRAFRRIKLFQWNGLVFHWCLYNKSRLPQDKTSFFLRVLKIFHSFSAFTREIFFQHSKKNLVSPRGHVISSIFVLTSGILWWEIWTRCCWSYQRFEYRWTRQASSRQSVYSTYIRGPVLRWVWTQGPYYVLWQELQSKYGRLTKFSLYLFVTVYFNNVL